MVVEANRFTAGRKVLKKDSGQGSGRKVRKKVRKRVWKKVRKKGRKKVSSLRYLGEEGHLLNCAQRL